MDSQHLRERMLARERVANVKKHWVRLVTACNSRCVFCLDTDTPRNIYIPEDEVKKELRRGREQLHADKVIISGGEASIHPKFIEFVRYAKEIGYDRVQTVTNGMMMSKREFYNAAVDAGLGEVTFSLHGHTAELHDRLTAVPGAFRKLMKGMMRAIRENRIIVNVDVCINKQNVPYIDRIVDLCLSVGVREYDLLHVIPQGLAFENRNDLFYDPIDHLPRLQKVFRLNRHPGVVIWTNRFPVEFLEDLEDLIQDPHKMLDEVNGRRFQVRKYIDEGTPLECRDKERCQYCFIEPFCNTADRVIARQNERRWEVWSVGAADAASWAPYASLTPAQMPYGCRQIGVEVDELSDLERLPVHAELGIQVTPARVGRMLDRDIVRNPLLIVAREPDHLDVLLGDAALPAGVALEVQLNQRTAPWLLAHRDRLQRHLAQLRLHQPSWEFLKDAIDNDVRNPQAFFTALALPVRVSGLPPCTTPNVEIAEAPRVLHAHLFDRDTGRLNIRELAREHVIRGYWGKSVRCRDCAVTDRCEGAHINFLRDQGFRQLTPLRDGAWAASAVEQMARVFPELPKRLRDGTPLQPVAESLPGFAPPQPAAVEPLMMIAEQVKEAREQRRREAAERDAARKAAAPPA